MRTPQLRISRDVGDNVSFDRDPYWQKSGVEAYLPRVSVASTYTGEETYFPLTSASGASLASGGASITYALSASDVLQDALLYTDSGKFDVYISTDGLSYSYALTVIASVPFRINIGNALGLRIKNPYGTNANAFVIAVQ